MAFLDPQRLRYIASGAIFALSLAAACPASARVLATVDGVEITDDDVQVALEDLGPTLPQQIEGPQREGYILDYLIDLRLVAKKAAAEKVAESADAARRLAYFRDKVMMETLLGKVAKDGATEAAMKQVYDDAMASMRPKYGAWVIFEHCMPFNVSRAYDEAKGLDHPRIWTAERDVEMWQALEHGVARIGELKG